MQKGLQMWPTLRFQVCPDLVILSPQCLEFWALDEQRQLHSSGLQFKQNREMQYTAVFVNQLETISSNQMPAGPDSSQM